jgi:hypothetical protein
MLRLAHRALTPVSGLALPRCAIYAQQRPGGSRSFFWARGKGGSSDGGAAGGGSGGGDDDGGNKRGPKDTKAGEKEAEEETAQTGSDLVVPDAGSAVERMPIGACEARRRRGPAGPRFCLFSQNRGDGAPLADARGVSGVHRSLGDQG